MAHLENVLHAVGIPFSALTSVIFGLMIVSFPLGAYAIFNSNIGDNIDYSFPLEKFDIFIAGVNIQVPLEYQIGDLFIIFWSIFIILFVISFLGPKKNFIKIIGNIFEVLKDFDEIVLAIQSLEEASKLTSSIGQRNEQLLKDLKLKLNKYSEYKSKMIIDYEMSKARYVQAIARAPRLTIGMTLPLIEELLGKPHDKVVSNDLNQKEQLWIYFLKDKSLELSFKDFILFKVEEK